MANVEIYTTTVCLYCIRAKSLLKSKNVEYVEHNMTGKDDEREKLLKMTGWSTHRAADFYRRQAYRRL